MTIRTITPSPAVHASIPVQSKLAAAWTSFMLLYIYVDVLNFYKPGVVDGILNGRVWQFNVSATLLTVMLTSVAIPAVMVTLSMALPARANRVTNLVVAALLVPYSIFNATGESGEWVGFYALSIGVELLLLAFILRSAWTWRGNSAGAVAVAESDLRLGTRQ
ncbi:DUF6326 family protein [Microbacterium sp.]|uniref:DUF6326 family protein n=1 Tax=Microbacterium sp. TaxID=51671 RepID=UPI0039E45B00